MLLDCSPWAPDHLQGGIIWWRRNVCALAGAEDHTGIPGQAFMILRSGAVPQWVQDDSAAAAPGQMMVMRPQTLHTFSVTKVNEQWVQGIRNECILMLNF